SQFHDIQAGLTGVGHGSGLWGDYDNDGALDILLTGEDKLQQPVAVIYHNDGNSQFRDIQAGLGALDTGSAAWADFDNDGLLDVVLTGNEGDDTRAVLYENVGDGQFRVAPANLAGTFVGSVSAGDYDRDGRLDILMTGADDNANPSAPVYHND